MLFVSYNIRAKFALGSNRKYSLVFKKMEGQGKTRFVFSGRAGSQNSNPTTIGLPGVELGSFCP